MKVFSEGFQEGESVSPVCTLSPDLDESLESLELEIVIMVDGILDLG